LIRSTRSLAEIALLIGGVLLAVFAVVMRIWLLAGYMAVGLAALAVMMSYRRRAGDYPPHFAAPNLTKAQQIALGYALSLPFWVAMWVYQRGHPAVIVAFVLGTAAAGGWLALIIRREGWSRRP
jgi:hypothetical protein